MNTLTILTLSHIFGTTDECRVFLDPTYAGNHIAEIIITIDQFDFENHKLEVPDSYEDAHKTASLHKISEEYYNKLYANTNFINQ